MDQKFAVVMFIIKSTTLHLLNKMNLSLWKEDWQMIVKYNHSGQDRHIRLESLTQNFQTAIT